MDDVYILIVFFTSLLSVMYLAPKLIRKLREKGYVVNDNYKPGKPKVADMGGLVLLGGVLASLIVAQFFVVSVETLLIFYLVGINFMVFGLIDDILGINRFWKMVLPFFLALPIALLNVDTSLWIGFTQIELGILYSLIIAPLYVMVVANLVNMHSGYNGLASGLTLILLCFVELKVFLETGMVNLIYIMPMLGALAGFFYFEKYPSKIFLGNCGSLFLGAILGGLLVLNNLELFGVIILTPHIINFLMYVVWKLKKVGEIKFGKIRADGTLEVPNNLTLKWVPNYYFRLTEQQSTFIMFLLTSIFGVMGL
ncbi:MAG: UDP-N-acetylglucosamine-1-phosphate transferase, partial [Candidatus Aenigmatarchaeota archaeon]